MNTFLEGDATHERRYWPNGQLNTQSLKSGDDAPEQYLQCLDATGQDLAPGGTGRFLQCTGDGDYREGTLLDGFLEGSMTWYDATGQGTGRANYKRGREG